MPPLVKDLALETIREFRMIVPGDRVAVACSGGADSTALLFLLHELAGPLGCVLSVAQLNHCLRGEESDADEAFVQRLAERLGLPCHIERADVRGLARAARSNLESEARQARLRFFRSLIESGQASRVALAHTADDQAETVLHRLLRGAGTKGLSGIHPVVRGAIIRPLLDVRRPALRQWLVEKGETWREDSSNRDLRFTRNRIRQQLLPLLAEFNPRVVETLSHTAALARAEEAFWEEHLKPLREAWVRLEDGKAIVDLGRLREAPPAVAYRLLRWAVALLPEHGATDLVHIHGLLRWALRGQSGTCFSLPNKLEARREFSHLILGRASLQTPGGTRAANDGYEYPVAVPGSITVAEAGLTFRFELVPFGAVPPRYNKGGSILLDGKVAEAPLLLRNWRNGDAYQPEGHGRPEKIQDLFQRRRIPLRERVRWPVLVSGGQIVWVRKMAAAAGFTASPDSSQVLAIRETGSG